MRRRLAELERQVRHAGLRVAALRAENQYVHDRAAIRQAAAVAELERQVDHLTAENEFKRQTLEEWAAYIAQVEAALAGAEAALARSPYRRMRGFLRRILRGVGLRRDGDDRPGRAEARSDLGEKSVDLTPRTSTALPDSPNA